MKKLFLLFLTALVTVSLGSCQSKDGKKTNSERNQQKQQERCDRRW